MDCGVVLHGDIAAVAHAEVFGGFCPERFFLVENLGLIRDLLCGVILFCHVRLGNPRHGILFVDVPYSLSSLRSKGEAGAKLDAERQHKNDRDQAISFLIHVVTSIIIVIWNRVVINAAK